MFVFCLWSPSMANLDPAIMAAQEAKAARWCQAQGIEKTSNLAFYSTPEDEALREAGRAVSQAWVAARFS